ncbi:MAG: hypothetical protein GY711_12795, partial [bacterium]|nr:hypothetical protein [bacterium]
MQASQKPTTRSGRSESPLLSGFPLLCGLLLAVGCGGSSGSADDPSPSDPGEALVDPETGRYFLVDENSGGISQTPRIL